LKSHICSNFFHHIRPKTRMTASQASTRLCGFSESKFRLFSRRCGRKLSMLSTILENEELAILKLELDYISSPWSFSNFKISYFGESQGTQTATMKEWAPALEFETPKLATLCIPDDDDEGIEA